MTDTPTPLARLRELRQRAVAWADSASVDRKDNLAEACSIVYALASPEWDEVGSRIAADARELAALRRLMTTYDSLGDCNGAVSDSIQYRRQNAIPEGVGVHEYTIVGVPHDPA